jgi:arsenate reductase
MGAQYIVAQTPPLRRGLIQAAIQRPLAGGRIFTITVYCIPNCDTIKRARDWLEARSVPYAFHDYKSAGIERATLERWSREVGWDKLLNRSGTTFRKTPEAERDGIDARRALDLMAVQPSMIRRPVLDTGRGLVVGFVPQTYESTLGEQQPSA